MYYQGRGADTVTPLWTLYRLQQVDSKISVLRGKTAQQDGAVAFQKRIEAGEQRADDALAECQRLRAVLKDMELRLASTEDRRKEMERQLYSGKTANPKELEGFSKEAEQLKSQQGQLEEQALLLMEQVESKVHEAESLKEKLAKVKNSFMVQQEAMVRAFADMEREIEDLSSKRANLATEVDGDLLAQYEALRGRKEGVAVALMSGTCCGECGASLPDSVRRKVLERELMLCTNCERILYNE